MIGIRTPEQNRLVHALFGELARGFSFESAHLTAAEWKIVLCSYFEAALAEADGRDVRDIPLPESTSKMDVSRADNFIEYLYFTGEHLGVIFSD
jgi:hypothetical protein